MPSTRGYKAVRGESIPLHAQDTDDDDEEEEVLVEDYRNDRGEVAKTSYSKARRIYGYLPCPRPTRTCVVILIFTVLALFTLLAFGALNLYRTSPRDGQSPPWYPTPKGGTVSQWQDSYEKAAALVSRMTLVEKANITTGTGWAMGLCVGNTGPAISVGFPALCLQDGPLGIRFADHATAFPAGITVGATWNRELMRARGAAHGREARDKGVHVILGPAMGPLGRNPAGGRNWEGFGSDPVLQAVAAAETIRGIQSQGVIATAKHWVGNEQEHYRQSYEWGLENGLSSNIDDRTLHEVYAWPFAESVRAGVASVMCSYQMVNNSYACGNSKLLNGILKDELGFQGFVQSDWRAQRGGVSSALAGLDMTMPGDGQFWQDGKSFWGPQLTLAVLNGSVPVDRLDDMVSRIVAAWYQLGQDKWIEQGPNFSSWTNDRVGKLYDAAIDSNETGVVNSFVDVQGNHSVVARQVAEEGIVLVKNEDSVLPLSRTGPVSDRHRQQYRVAIIGEDARGAQDPNHCPDRGCNEDTLAVGWGSGASEFPHLIDPFSAINDAFDHDRVNLTTHLENGIPSDLARQDLCLVFANADSGEGYMAWNGIHGDRNDLNLQKGGNKLIQDVANGCGGGTGNTVVVIHAVGPVIVESWADLPGVKAIVLAHLPGQESGAALANVLFGHVDASGRLPYTMGRSLKDYGPGAQVLYTPSGIVPQVDFTETLYIDYRQFDKYHIEPRHEFGFGLSYTTFELTDLKVTPLTPKSSLPAPRPPALQPPTYPLTVPNAALAVFPSGFRKLNKYIYPYINNVKEVVTGTYPYPSGYHTPQTPSAAGGDEGGNPELFVIYVQVDVCVTNTGFRTGKAVVQVYVSFPDNVIEPSTGEHIEFPVKVLRNFVKIELEQGASQTVSLNLTRKDLSYFSVVQQNWVMPDGEFDILVGRSSRNLPLHGRY